MSKINSYIITGFLGSGKTTLLNNLLLEVKEEKNVVIENEFGKINIDATLITDKLEGVFELTNGCICCSINGQLNTTLQEIKDLKVKPNNLFIETTGIADAGEVGASFNSFYFNNDFDLKKIVCVVDAENVMNYYDSNIEIQKQIIASDCVVLNKVNDLEENKINQVKELIYTINPLLPIIESKDRKVDLESINKVDVQKQKPEFNPIVIKASHKIKTVFFETEKKFNIKQLRYELFKSLYLYYQHIFRIKGYVVDENNQVFLVQSVGKSSTVEIVENKNNIKSELVIIGKEIELKSIERILKPALQKNKNTNEV
jgi:G3E family GTPase